MAEGERATELLEPSLLARLERLQLSTRRRLAGRFSGEHRSPRYGSSLDFADYRDYHPGDDFRRIDYALYARTDQLFIRLFEAEDDLTMRILLDTSASMGLYGKLDQARRLGGALGFIGLVRRDAVHLVTFPSARADLRFAGRGAVPALFAALSALEAAGVTDVGQAAGALLARRGPPGVTIVISDLLTDSWTAALDRLPARGGDVVLVHVLATEEIEPDLTGDLDLLDSETGERLAVSVSTDTARDFTAATHRWLADVAARCQDRNVGYVRVRADADLESTLTRAWRRDGVLR